MLPMHGDATHVAQPGNFWTLWWPVEWVPFLGVAAGLCLYLWGARLLRRRGDVWSVWRTLSFGVGGLGSIFIATQGPLARYDTILLSTHMVQHMILTMVAPVFLALGAPMTLALRTFGPRPRRWLMAVLNSTYIKVITFPVVAGIIFVLNPWLLYFTGYYAATLEHPLLHDFNHLHFLVVGCIWAWALVGIDPLPKMNHLIKLLAVFVTLPFHAFLGVTIMGQRALIAGDFYHDLGRTWGPSLAEDQRLAGGILWITGDVAGLLLMVVLFVQWAQASEREARRVDRELDRQEALAHEAEQQHAQENQRPD